MATDITLIGKALRKAACYGGADKSRERNAIVRHLAALHVAMRQRHRSIKWGRPSLMP